MTQPIDGAPGFVKLEYNNPAGLELPVSHGATNTWITIPWDTEIEDPALPNRPNGMHDPNGWTGLYGPCLYMATAYVRVKQQQQDCSLHLMPRVAKRVNGANTIVHSEEAIERGVLKYESHPQPDGTVTYSNTHLDSSMVGRLEADQRLQFVVDYWNATESALIVGATVSILYWVTPQGA